MQKPNCGLDVLSKIPLKKNSYEKVKILPFDIAACSGGIL